MSRHEPSEPLRRTRSRSGRGWQRRLVLLALVLTTLAVAVVTTLTAAARDRSDRLRAAHDVAELAVHEARRADARRWAPEDLAEAESLFWKALADRRLEETNWLRGSSFDDAQTGFRLAAAAAERAAAAAASTAASTRQEAESAIGAAGGVMARAEDVARTAAVRQTHRVALQRGRLKLAEARSLFDAAAYESALTAATAATAFAAEVQAAGVAHLERFTDADRLATWRQWLREAVDWSARSGQAAIVVDKRAHELTLYRRGRAVVRYAVELGTNWTADKTHAGDAATPEGRYRIVEKKGPGRSAYHRALLLDYPNAEDRRAFTQARREGLVPPATGIGGAIELHGEGDTGQDWTLGCIALRNGDIDDLFEHVSVGTPVTIIGATDHVAHDSNDSR